ncbi:hypothetical protein [Sphingobium sp. LSP13-1-1.1]|uniref:hypothetical protein n=1 Tax=Sphingobium sp. LSP13-1-1.1 TaxID=3135234 RepID=UPI003420DF49
MTLQTSGPISIGQARDEFQLSNPVSMSHFYGKNGFQSSGAISFSDFYGKSNLLDTQVVTVRRWFEDGFDLYYGFKSGTGSCADGTSNIYGGIAITRLCYDVAHEQIEFDVASTVANSGWTTMYVNGTPFLRSSATFSNGRQWRWNTNNNVFGTTENATRTIQWY